MGFTLQNNSMYCSFCFMVFLILCLKINSKENIAEIKQEKIKVNAIISEERIKCLLINDNEKEEEEEEINCNLFEIISNNKEEENSLFNIEIIIKNESNTKFFIQNSQIFEKEIIEENNEVIKTIIILQKTDGNQIKFFIVNKVNLNFLISNFFKGKMCRKRRLSIQ